MLYYIPQYKTTSLEVAGGINIDQTTGIKLANVDGVDTTKPGLIAVSYAQPIDTSTIEFITYTSVDANNELVGATRGCEGFNAHTHDNGAVIAYVFSKSHVNNMNDQINSVTNGISFYAADSGANDTYAITLDPAPSAYTAGMLVNFKANTANTGACTLNCNALGAKAIKKSVSNDTVTGDILAGQLVSVIYDGTNFQLLSGRNEIIYVEAQVVSADSDVETGDGKFYFTIPPKMTGMNLVEAHAVVITAGTTNTTDIQIANVTDTVDMLSTKLTIDSTETSSATAATPVVIDATKDDVVTNDLLRIDLDATSTTKAKGLVVRLGFQLP